MQNIQTLGFSEKTDSVVAGKASFPADIYLLKVNHKNIWIRCKICSKLMLEFFENSFALYVLGWVPHVCRGVQEKSRKTLDYEASKINLLPGSLTL